MVSATESARVIDAKHCGAWWVYSGTELYIVQAGIDNRHCDSSASLQGVKHHALLECFWRYWQLDWRGRRRAAERPNVLLICVDDLKPLLGCYGDTTVKSPNIDALAERGVMFKRAYCNQAVCCAVAECAADGSAFDHARNLRSGDEFSVSRPDAVTLPQYFKQNGYRTEGMGKVFHHGHGNHEDDASWSVPFWRSDVVNYALQEHADANKNSREAALFNNVTGAKAKDLAKGVAYESADVPDNMYPDGQTADEAIKRLRQRGEGSEAAVLFGGRIREAAFAVLCAEEVLGSVRPGDVQIGGADDAARRCAAVRRT